MKEETHQRQVDQQAHHLRQFNGPRYNQQYHQQVMKLFCHVLIPGHQLITQNVAPLRPGPNSVPSLSQEIQTGNDKILAIRRKILPHHPGIMIISKSHHQAVELIHGVMFLLGKYTNKFFKTIIFSQLNGQFFYLN